MSRRITIGIPVYNGTKHVAGALRSLQAQTFRDFEAIISVDGDDQATADVCRPFLADARFRMVVHSERLDWFGNFNWLLRQPLGEFFCYRQHDDMTAPQFFEVLLRTADARPDAAAVYADCQWRGGRNDIEIAPSIEGETLDRLRQYIEQKYPVAVRGLIRREAAQQAGPIRADEFRGLSEIFVWLTKVLRWGSFVRVPEPLYYRLDHEANYYKQWFDWPEGRKRASWATLFTGLLEATMPVCTTPEERLFFQHFILDRIVVVRPGQSYHYTPTTPHSSGELIGECLKRLAQEGNMHLLGIDEIPAILQTTARVQALQAENARLGDLLAEGLERLKRDGNMHLPGIEKSLVVQQACARAQADDKEMFAELQQRRKETARLQAQLYQRRTEADEAKKQLQVVYRSRSWRFTKPLRAIRSNWLFSSRGTAPNH